MNNIKLMVVTLLAVCLTAPAFAQSVQEEKLAKALEKQAASMLKLQAPSRNPILALMDKNMTKEKLLAALQSMEKSGKFTEKEIQRAKDVIENEPDMNKSASFLLAAITIKVCNQCMYCGKEITSAGQHCSAQGYTGICKGLKLPKGLPSFKSAAKTLSESKAADVCAYCHEPIEYSHQHCAAQGYVGLCSPEKAETQKNTVQSPATHCPVCGEELSIDERFHGAKHVCPEVKESALKNKTATTQDKRYCIYCGEEITSSSQHCSAAGYNTLCTDLCPQCGLDLRDPHNVGPDGVHRCNLDKRLRIKPVEAKK